ncbi:hypothetical protein ASG90_05365 [Nocardioides sp. Soil797]|nr:hypothetical protein ASG90_05365 [Nocardioides sp. Soil797]
MIAGVVFGVLLVAGVATTGIVVATAGDDNDDTAGKDPSSDTSQTSTGTSDPTLSLPSPTPSSPPSKTFTRTPVTGDDTLQVKQLAADYTEWTKAIYAGDVGACDYMKLYVVKVSKKATISCKKAAATPLPSGDKIEVRTQTVQVRGNKATITFRYDYTFSGKSNHTTSDQPAVKKNGDWFLAEP